MDPGAFSISLAVKDIAASRAFYVKLGFKVFGGDAAQNWLIMKSGTTLVGLFHHHNWHAPNGDHTPGEHPHPPHPAPAPNAGTAGPLRCPRPNPRSIHERIATDVASALRPHAARLRATPQEAASVIIALTFGAQHPIAGHPSFSSPEALADLALHGLLKEA